nr:hypothetical protein CFP56_78055 [Quercus suber]
MKHLEITDPSDGLANPVTAITRSYEASTIVNRLQKLSQTFNSGSILDAHVRVDMIAAAKDLILALSSPEDHVWQRAINVGSSAELFPPIFAEQQLIDIPRGGCYDLLSAQSSSNRLRVGSTVTHGSVVVILETQALGSGRACEIFWKFENCCEVRADSERTGVTWP